MISTIIRKIDVFLKKSRRIFFTRKQMRAKKSDKDRWEKQQSLFASWDERTEILSQQIKPNTTVFEFGAARLVLKEMLPKGCTYLQSDIVKRNAETIVLDLNKELPTIPQVDYVVFSGVLEYIFNVPELLVHLTQFTDNIVFSYATSDAYPKKSNRRYNGWVSDLSDKDIKHIVNEAEWELDTIDYWNKQTLYHLQKK